MRCLAKILVCPECNGKILRDPLKAEEICSECGLVLTEKEFRERHDLSKGKGALNTIIVKQSTLKYHKICSKDQYRRLKTNSKKLAKEKAKLRAIFHINQLCGKFNVPNSIREKTILFFNKAHDKKIARGRTIELLVASCFYYCCRENGFCLTIQELARAMDTEVKIIQRCFFSLHQNFKLVKKVLSPLNYLSKFISDLGLDYAIEKQARELINKFPNYCQIGKNPKGICAGAIYFICKNEKIKITQEIISEVTGVTELTIRNRVKDIRKLSI